MRIWRRLYADRVRMDDGYADIEAFFDWERPPARDTVEFAVDFENDRAEVLGRR